MFSKLEPNIVESAALNGARPLIAPDDEAGLPMYCTTKLLFGLSWKFNFAIQLYSVVLIS